MCQIPCAAGIGAASGAIAGTCIAGPAGLIGSNIGAAIGALGGVVSSIVTPLFNACSCILTIPLQAGIAIWIGSAMGANIPVSVAFILSVTIHAITIGLFLGIAAVVALVSGALAPTLKSGYR